MHNLVNMHHNQIYFIHISILTKYSDHVQLRSHFYNLSLAHNVHRASEVGGCKLGRGVAAKIARALR
jgi:hypothetical protein